MIIKFKGDTVLNLLKDEKEKKQKREEMMLRHSIYYQQFQEGQYVTTGSILRCSGGINLSVLDMEMSHGIEWETGETEESVVTCRDCRLNHNIFAFGGCKKPTPEDYPERRKVKLNGGLIEAEECIPILDKSWHKLDDDELKIWVNEAQDYIDAVTTEYHLTCFCGGIISVMEVPQVVYPNDFRKTKSLDINCYGYAFGFDRYMYPGQFSVSEGTSEERLYTLDDLKKYVENDMRSLFVSIRTINDPSECNSDEFVVAMKISIKVEEGEEKRDFHFAVQLSDGTWADKPGSAASRWNHLDGTDDVWGTDEDSSFYNSESVFFAVNRKEAEKASRDYR